MTTMRAHWPHYLIEAWGLGTIMFVTGAVAVGLAHAPPPLAQAFAAHPVFRRMIAGMLIGLTAMAVVYSPLGARSGAALILVRALAERTTGSLCAKRATGVLAGQRRGAVTRRSGLLGSYRTKPHAHRSHGATRGANAG